MKVYVVLYETCAGHEMQTLLIMRKAYRKDAIMVRRWNEAEGLSEVYYYKTDMYTRAAELYMSVNEPDYERLLAVGEVLLK